MLKMISENLKIIPLTRSTQQVCLNCHYSCPYYGQHKECPKCHKQFDKCWWSCRSWSHEDLMNVRENNHHQDNHHNHNH